ncbi:MAG: polysaccharide pyruvyl transferase family protein [Chloroflexota bacterium]
MNILLIHLYSAQNLGDDAIMYETLRGLNEIYPDARVTLAASDPDSWRKYRGVMTVGSLTTWVARLDEGRWRARVLAVPLYLFLLTLSVLLHRFFRLRLLFGSEEKRRLLLAYYTADLVLSCGGGNLYAHAPLSPFFLWSLLTLALALGLGKRVIMLPQSVGPIEGRFQRMAARLLFDRVAWMLLREQRSIDFVQRVMHLRRQPVLLPDLAFGPTPAVASPVDLAGSQDGPRIGVTVIDRAVQVRAFSGQETYEAAVASALIRLSRDRGASLYLFSQCNGPNLAHDDRWAVRRLYHRLQEQGVGAAVFDAFDSSLALKSAYASMDCLLGSRMHSAILALSGAVPVVLIGYQPKSFGVMESLGLEQYCCDIETVTADRLYEMVCQALDNRAQIAQFVAARYAETQARLREWTRYLE